MGVCEWSLRFCVVCKNKVMEACQTLSSENGFTVMRVFFKKMASRSFSLKDGKGGEGLGGGILPLLGFSKGSGGVITILSCSCVHNALSVSPLSSYDSRNMCRRAGARSR